jgi:uncharacterized protein (DUF1684 family)
MTTDSYSAMIEAWRANYERGLAAPTGWLAIIGLVWLQEGENSFGTNPDHPIVLPRGTASAHAGSFVLEEGVITLRVNPEEHILFEEQPVLSSPIPVSAGGSSKPITVGRLTVYAIRRGDQYAVRIYDPNNSARQAFQGVEWFPIDEQYCIQASFTPLDKTTTISVTNILGMTEESHCPGFVTFILRGQEYRLYPVAPTAQDRFFFMFRDTTSGEETYPAGRYLYADPPRNNLTTLDFNKAYSPPCAFTDYATCTLPPPQNHLPIPIRAGAKYSRSSVGHEL